MVPFSTFEPCRISTVSQKHAGAEKLIKDGVID